MPSKACSAGTYWRAADGAAAALPEYISPAFQDLIAAAPPAAAAQLRRQVTASACEELITETERADPLGEARYCITPYLVHQYPNRVLLLATGRCLSYCRYCFRREFTARTSGFISAEDTAKVTAYLKNHPEVQEILVSGGDPMSGSFAELSGLLNMLRNVSPDLLIRLCTRAPVFAPELFTPELIRFLRKVRPLWVVVHINHPAELGKQQRNALCRCIDSGIPVLSQTVLLRGVNDEVSMLAELFHALVCLGVKPGYLFQTDLARGTADFRVPLDRAARIWKELRNLLSGLSLPQFAVDLPGGGGKFPLSAVILHEAITAPLQDGNFSARGIDGAVYTYPGIQS
ncbi:MAG: KamA family radical SAM protein [Treponema sp.]